MKGRGAWLPCLLLVSGCAPLSYRAAPPASFPGGRGAYLESTPAVAQRAYQCGPAALESVLRHWGQPANAEQLRQALVTPGTRGVLNFTLANYPRTQGLWTEVHQAGPDDLRAWLKRGIPPIVMLRVGPWGIPAYHYVVVRGFDDQEGIFYANTGDATAHAIPYAAFERRWKDAQRWCLIVVPAERVDWDLAAAQAGELAFLLERTGRPELAERWYQTALTHEPDSPALRFNLANVYSRTQKREEAMAIYRELLNETPQWGAVSNNLAWIAVESGKPDEAIRLIEHAFAAGAPRDYDILDTLGLAYCRMQQPQTAQGYFVEALQNVPPSRTDAAALIQRHAEECAPSN